MSNRSFVEDALRIGSGVALGELMADGIEELFDL